MLQALAAVFRWLASLKLAVVLILVLAAVLAWATLLESSAGRDYAQWYVYKSPWFIALLALLGVNILASTLIRFPWVKSRRGFVVTHAGLLVLLFGAIQTFQRGVEGQLIFAEGQSVDSIQMLDQCQLKLAWQTQPNRSTQYFTFRPGPVDWQPGHTLDFGELDGVRLKVLRFLRHARCEENWVADEAGEGGPAIKFAVADPRGKTVLEDWLAVGPFGRSSRWAPPPLSSSGRRWRRWSRISSGRRAKRWAPRACFRCTLTAGWSASGWARTWARRSPWATARSASRSRSICPTLSPMPTPTSFPRTSSPTIPCWS